MKQYIVAALAAAALATDLAAPASAQTQTVYANNPVTLRDFTASPVLSPVGSSTLGGFDLSPTSTNLTISFLNTANVAAKSIEFEVQSGSRTVLIVDKGTFAPGTRIVHRFNESSELDNISSVRVQAVTFADGSSWNG